VRSRCAQRPELARLRLLGLLAVASSLALLTGAPAALARRAAPPTDFATLHRDRFELLGVSTARVRASSDRDPSPREVEVRLHRLRALAVGCVTLSARVGEDGAHVQSISVNVVAADAPVALPRSAGASDRLRVGVGDAFSWPLPAEGSIAFRAMRGCLGEDTEMGLLLAGELPHRACTLDGRAPRAWRLPPLLVDAGLRCSFASAGRGEVRTTAHRFYRVRARGRVQGDLSAIESGPRELFATHVHDEVPAHVGPDATLAFVPPRRVARVGDWVFEVRDDVSAHDEDLLACLHEQDSACRVSQRSGAAR
jgi:hypothetical protein